MGVASSPFEGGWERGGGISDRSVRWTEHNPAVTSRCGGRSNPSATSRSGGRSNPSVTSPCGGMGLSLSADARTHLITPRVAF